MLYIGIKSGIEERAVPPLGVRLEALSLTTPDSFLKLPRALLDMLQASRISWQLLGKFRASVLFSTGGFVSVPATLAAWIRRVPIVIFLPDVVPGLTVRLTSRLARQIALSSSDTCPFFSPGSPLVVTGYPVRESFAATRRESARLELNLDPQDRLLLVMGGSLGAQAINEAIALRLPDLLEVTKIYHIAGKSNMERASRLAATLPESLARRYELVPTVDEKQIATVMFAADLAVTRAGASILGELPAAALPAIVVPLPAARVNQMENARALCSDGGCVVLSNQDAATGSLSQLILELMGDDNRLKQMSAAMAAKSRPSAAAEIGSLVLRAARAA